MFYMEDFDSGVPPQDKETAHILKNICDCLIRELGGSLTHGKTVANYCIYYRQDLKILGP